MSFDVYQAVTDQIVAMLESGVAPWRSPILGRSSAGHPRNMQSGKQYRGANTFLLAFSAFSKGYGSSYWLTFNQAKERGASVRKGEKSSMVVFWKQFETKDKASGKDITIPLLRYYNVFNAEQCADLAAPDTVAIEPLAFNPIDSAERITSSYAGSPVVANDGGQKAFYRPSTDSIHMPAVERFASSEEYYSTLFHELSHSTGHVTRLDRKLDELQSFGSANYGREELVAEMSAAYLSAEAGIKPAVIDNQAAYLNGWISQLKGDKKLILSASGQAQRSADWILGNRPEESAD